MEPLDSILHKLNLPTSEISTEKIQEILSAVKIINWNDNHEEDIKTVLDKLWRHLATQLVEFDDQLLMSICFYTVLSHCKNQEIYLSKIDELIKNDITLKERNIEKGQTLYLSVSLSYGIFQSSYLLQKFGKQNELLLNVLDAIFLLTSKMAYEYSPHTFIIFKIMSSFKKVIGTQFQNSLFCRNYQIKILNLINHNWENPITGVRSLNRILFQTLIIVLDSDMYSVVLNEINCFYWNKAKYLMLAEIIEHYKGNFEEIILKYNWVEGLIYSLFKPGLVSAGTDMYNSILKKTSSDNTWTAIFLGKVMEVLGGTSFKAIENFNNYWCLNTLKKFPLLMNILMKELHEINDSQYKLYSIIAIMKQGNKLGLIERTWTMPTKHNIVVPLSIEHSDTSIRILAFEIICVTQGKYIPTEIEYQQVLNFLHDNVNSDCTVLRISMINSLTFFLTKLHNLYLNNIKAENIYDINNLKMFCLELQQFVVKSFDFDGNYQRKTTTLKIVHTMLKCFNTISKKKTKEEKCLLKFLKDNNCWILDTNKIILKLVSLLKDPASDVQQGVLQVLSEYYSKELSETIMINHLIEEGLKCISSKFFYEISCGHNIFQLIIHIIFTNKNTNCQFSKAEDIFEFAFREVTTEYKNQDSIVQSIENGKQLHSFLSLISILFATFVRKSCKLNISKENIFKLLDILEQISKQFVCEDESQTSSDFSKMNVMVESLIKSSGLTYNTEDETKISGLHQIILNCLWLNVKASCELAGILIQNYENDSEICRKCLNIICDVLETSRHKGAIEAAGCTLGQGIHFLTSQNESETSKLPFTLLQKKLNELLFETSKMSSVTRRGAGLSIMVHRIVSNDTKKGKPLFHYFMKTLLETCNNIEVATKNDNTSDIDNEKDLPKAIYIHFLTRIVTDSSLASDCMYYSAELAALAFDNLTDSHWQIRNAALQLYGALIPKLIGQKKASGTDDETIATVACDEFRTHSPKLWKYIIEQIQHQNQFDIIQAHSNLVPILNALSSIARRYNFSYDLLKQEKCDLDLLPSLFNLLGSPIYTVRRLTSQCITNIYSFNIIYEAIINDKNRSENFLHGILLLVSSCYKIYYEGNQDQVHKLLEKYKIIIENEKHSYICKWTLEKILSNAETNNEVIITADTIRNLLCEEKRNRYHPGISLWVNVKIQRCLTNMEWKFIPEALKILSILEDFDNYCKTCIQKIQNSAEIGDLQMLAISNVLMSEIIIKSSAVWELLYNISLNIDISDVHNYCSHIFDFTNNPTYKFRYILPFAARTLAREENSNILIVISECIYLLSNPAHHDVDMRYIASLSNNELVNNFDTFPDNIKSNILKTAIILLQDEDDDIRNLSVNVYKKITKDNDPKHPLLCLSKILSRDFLYNNFHNPEFYIPNICKDLLHFIDSLSINKIDDYNPFASDSKNIYLEVNVLKQSLDMLSCL